MPVRPMNNVLVPLLATGPARICNVWLRLRPDRHFTELIQQVLSPIILALFDSKIPGALLSYQEWLLRSCKGHSRPTCLVVSRPKASGQ